MLYKFDDIQKLMLKKWHFKQTNFKAGNIDKRHFPGYFFIWHNALLAQQFGSSLWALDNIISCCAKRRQSTLSLTLIYHFYFSPI